MIALTLALALAAPPDPAPPAAEATPAPAAEPAPVPDPAAVAAACGDPYALVELAFTFVVVKDGEEVVRRRHRWRPSESSVEVSLPDGTVDVWTNPPPSKPADPGHAAWSAFVNDSYWLLAPCKVGDQGVTVRAEPGVLALSFDGVGLTPGDAYRLEVDAQGRVTGWQYTLQSGREGAFDWSPYTEVGPLHLSLERRSRAGDTVIRFEQVEAK